MSEQISSPQLVKKYITSVDLNDIFHTGNLLESAKILIDLQDNFQQQYSDITFSDFDQNNDVSLSVYGYRTQTEDEIQKQNAGVLQRQAQDYQLYLELKKRFEPNDE